MSDKPSSSTKQSLLPRSMSLKRRKPEKKGSGAVGGSGVKGSSGVGILGGPRAQTEGNGNARRRNSDSVAGHAAPLETFKLPSWLVPPSVYKNKHHISAGHRKGYVRRFRCVFKFGMLIFRIARPLRVRNGGMTRRLPTQKGPSHRRTFLL
jgi:hypothetical protein